ncbi:unnamed protein product [Rotaria sp. Silwood2]|nr:unnamed protein product [Rotaria sp. Silwood2]CAF3064642.1 unnamed protein product [Rotaria sp. Silwood2]CAF3381613.1 unnamed protein product [Rotaria sp. Silwood2]CAF4258370.1 unnamed protein product [Rotaria sp. Silwood2]CAF4580090.1 unnamed protein product [Rotaria sp. Silwood2]
MLKVRLDFVEEVLDSFRSSYWQEEKCWFVAYNSKHLFSVPSFADRKVSNYFRPPIHSTTPNPTIYYDQITDLSLYQDSIKNWPRLKYVTTLELYCHIRHSILQTVFNLNRIQHLILSSSVDRSIVILTLNEMTNLRHISIWKNVPRFLEYVRNLEMDQIRTVDLGGDFDIKDHNIIDSLGSVFPRVERLRIPLNHACVCLDHLIDNLKYLAQVSFFCNRIHDIDRSEQSEQLKHVILTNSNSNCRYDRLLRSIHVWIDDTLQKI